MDADKLFEGIALLIDLAQRGEIDPWDVQVIEVLDRYLSEFLLAQEAMQLACEADLSQSGQAFLSASMLVLFKANTLELEQREASDLELSAEDFEANNGEQAPLRLPLDHHLIRRPAALPPQKRRVTLQELIDQLQLMAIELQSQSEAQSISTKTNSSDRLSPRSRSQAIRATLNLAHQENLTQVAGELEQVLNRHHHILDRQQDWLNLDQLVELWTQSTHSAPMASSSKPQAYDRVSVFWALLLLSAQSKVELSQDEFYQEIKLRSILA